MKQPNVRYACGHNIPFLSASDLALQEIAAGGMTVTDPVTPDDTGILKAIAAKILQERAQ